MTSTDAFVEVIVGDLRALSPDLLEVGVADAVSATTDVKSAGSMAVLLRQAKVICHLVPRLLANLEEASFSREEHYPTRVPKRVVLARTPRSYELRDGKLLPREWLRPVVVIEFDLAPLGFLLHLLGRTSSQVEEAELRVGKYLEDALPSREVDSTYARAEADALRDLRDSIQTAKANLARAVNSVRVRSGYRREPSPLFPKPFPRSPVWGQLRLLATEILNPKGVLAAQIQQILGEPISTADMSFLYQRWCGAKLLGTLEQMGWLVLGDRVAALFLGGNVTLRKGNVEMVLWVEPRLTAPGKHPSGMHSVRKREAAPDFVLITSGRSGQDAFVLDPTKTADRERHKEKSRYLSCIAFDELGLVAGNVLSHTPIRSWAAAPIGARQCVVDAGDGRSGTIPMFPVGFNAAPLRAWLDDVEAHALAWGRFHLAAAGSA